MLLIVFLLLTHNFLFLVGYSIKGDYPDYLIFSLEYLVLCISVVLLYKSKSVYAKPFRFIGTAILSLGGLIGLIGIFLFIPISEEYEANKTFYFKANNIDYETRRYSFAFATIDNIKYTFDTYKVYPFLIEKKIDSSVFFDTKTELNIGEDKLKISIGINEKNLIFTSTNDKIFSKRIK